MKVSITLAALSLAALSLSGCNSAQVSTDIQAALNYGCPVLGAIQAQKLPLSNAQLAAEQTLALACPPNPMPTSVTVAAADLVSAASLLLPLLPKAQADGIRVRLQRVEIDLNHVK